MGTRGAFGVVADGVEKIGYNQMDSYPEGHGIENLQWLRASLESGFEDSIRQAAIEAQLVDEDTSPTDEQIAKLSAYTDLKVSSQSTDDWYCLTRDTHGNIWKMLECGFILDSRSFAYDSLFCEWGYILDFDRRQFEVYKGFNKGKAKGRFSDGSVEKGYGPITLIAVYSFDDLPTDENFLTDTAGPECSDCGYRRPVDEGTTVNGVFTCEYCLEKKAAV